MPSKTNIATVLLAASLLLAVPSGAGASNCIFKVKNCRAPGTGTVNAYAYNGDDMVHMVAISESLDIGHGEIVDLFCARAHCDTVIRVENNPHGQSGDISAYDICKNITVLDGQMEYVCIDLRSCD